MKTNKLQKLTIIGVMIALSTVIYMFFPEIPLVPGVEYLKIDFSDMPAVLGGLTVSPLSGVVIEIVKNAIHLLRTTTLGIGELMNIGIGSSMIIAVSLSSKLFSKLLKKDKMSVQVYFLSAAVGIIATIAAGWLFNGILTPVYFNLMGIPVTGESVLAGVLGSTLLNTVKAAFNLLPFYPVYLAVYKANKKYSA